MSERSFRWALIAISAMILLSIPTMPGAIIGVFFGFGLAFFVAGPGWIISGALQKHGYAASFEEVMIALAAIYGGIVVAMGALAAMGWRSGNKELGRLLAAKTALFAALPIMAWLSMNAMADAWPG
ncbi:MAG TPA: hypothetical protein VM662_04215 [Sphingomonas sp.]|nr:hypothetical protein [Sphingomonas sp.]